MAGRRVTIRLDEREYAACREQAADMQISVWFRHLAQQQTGLSFAHERGFASMSAEKRREASRAGGKASRRREGGAAINRPVGQAAGGGMTSAI